MNSNARIELPDAPDPLVGWWRCDDDELAFDDGERVTYQPTGLAKRARGIAPRRFSSVRLPTAALAARDATSRFPGKSKVQSVRFR
ncbi:hypothetical protein [Natrinema salaciae]|uniref:hypothetical protein n=1 Tax=Natrinema salaciae TaxID=1186196 RepID=UPI000B82C7A3|nr:hypothetical protein [Natrinema salaciae]